MIKIFFKIVIITIIMFSLPINSYGYNNINNKKYRLNEIKKVIQKENQIVSMVENYIFLTGDVNVTSNKLITFFKLNNNFFKGIKNNIDIKIENGILILSNVLQSYNNTIDNFTTKLYNQYKNYNYNSYLKNNNIYIQLNENSKKAINFLKNLPSNYLVDNNNSNLDINKTILTYNGNGFKIKKFNKTINQWQELGYYDLNNKKGIIVNNSEDLNSLNDIKNITAYIIKSNGVDRLKPTINGWKKIEETNGNYFIGDGTIFDAACKIYNYDGGSQITINPSKEPYINSIQTFTKKEVSNENGYWINNNNNMLIIKDMNDIKYINLYNNINNLFICSPNRASYYILKKENINNNVKWIIELNSMEDMLNFNGDYMTNEWFFVKNNNIYFQKINNIFYSKYKLYNNIIIDFTDYIVGAGTRDIFNNITLLNNKIYLTTLDDCSVKNNCSGATISIFGGEKIDGLFKWSKINNSLEDVAVSNLTDAYSKGFSYFYNNNNKTFFKKIIDNNGNYCYYDINNNKILTENGTILNNNFYKIENNIINIVFPLSTISCNNNLNNKFKSGLYKDYNNNNINVSFLSLNSLSDLKNWNINSNLKDVVINNKLFTYINNQWQSYDTVFVIGNRTNLKYFDNNNDKLFYTTDLDNGETYNNGFFDKETGLYIWEYAPNSNKQLNGFIDIFKANDITDAYINFNKIYNDFFIDNKKYYKIKMNIDYCIKDYNNNYISYQNKIIPKEYINGNNLLFPLNTNCINVNIKDNKVVIDNFNNLLDLAYDNLIFLYNDKEIKILNKNNLLYSNNYIVIGNRNNFNFNDYNFNFNYIYTTIDDTYQNNNINILGNNRVYRWEYYKDIDGLGSINKLVESFKPKNCMDILNVLHLEGNQIIYDINDNKINVECNNGETIITLKQLNNITFNILNNETNYLFDKNNLSFQFFNGSENELIMNIDIPINYQKIKINNFSFSDNNYEIKFSNDYKISLYNSDVFNDFLNNINIYFDNFLNKNNSNKTNYIAIGLLNNNNQLIDEINENKNFNNIYFNNNGKIKLEILFNNKDNTTNIIKFNENISFSLLP